MSLAESALGHVDILPDELPYIASKGAIHQLTASLAAHLAPRGRTGPRNHRRPIFSTSDSLSELGRGKFHNCGARAITLNTIIPGVIPGATDTGYAEELKDEVLALEPQGRWGKPDDAARLIAWLCSDHARWITGKVINSNGGGP